MVDYLTVPLSQGKVALVSPEDYERVSAYKWSLWACRGLEYVVRSFGKGKDRRQVSLHRYVLNAPKGTHVDHKNGDGLDNRRENIRLCTVSSNAMNRRKAKGKFSSQYKGISWSAAGHGWVATIRINGESNYLGTFHREEEAARAYDAAAVRLFGEFAYVNFT